MRRLIRELVCELFHHKFWVQKHAPFRPCNHWVCKKCGIEWTV